MQAFEFFTLLTKLSFKSNLKFRNQKLSKLSVLINPINTAMKVFKHLQLISIKNPILYISIPLNIFLFNN